MTITIPSPLDVAAAGGHHLLLYGHGPMHDRERAVLVQLLALLPDLDPAEAAEVEAIHTAAGEPRSAGFGDRPPAAHARAWFTQVELLGGGSPPRPGEVSLAHRGLLVLRDLPSFSRACIEGLRELVEYDRIAVDPERRRVYPARFTLVATMGPCPCGWLGHHEQRCEDTPEQVQRHRARVSGLVPERVDLLVPIDTAKSRTDRATIELARARARQRLAGTGWLLDGQIPVHDCQAIERLCPITEDGEQALLELVRERGSSVATLHRLRRVARTIADLQPDRDPAEPLGPDVIAAAIGLRSWPPFGAWGEP